MDTSDTSTYRLSGQEEHTMLTAHTGNTLGAATNTVGKGVQGVTDATGNVVAAGGKGLGDAVTGITQGAGDTTKGKPVPFPVQNSRSFVPEL
jgi:hypothetical protein